MSSGQIELPGVPPPARLPFDVRGFTFWRPWGEAIVRPVPPGATAPCPKRVDNRPPRSVLGSREGHHIAIHTGLTVHPRGLAWINETFGYGWSEGDLEPPGVILGVARVLGRCVQGVPWFFGPTWEGEPNEGWLLGDVIAFDPPVRGVGGAPIKGALGCWRMTAPVLGEVTERALALGANLGVGP